MRVLLIGTGGREHALALAFAHDPAVDELICAPGNPGMGAIAKLRNVVADDPAAVCELAVDTQADLVVIGPEAPLVAGVADAVRAHGIACFGPSADAARIEGSKDYAKDVMREAGVPTAASVTCHRQADAETALDRFGPPYVVKDDGLAAGKGVIVTADRDAASAHVSAILSGNDDRAVVIEEFLDGPEASLFVIADGEEAVPLLPAQDFKRVANNDEGPNTGGMGAYAPLPWLAEGFVDEVMETVARPTLRELVRRGAPFNGVLYCGLALTRQGPKVIEFNCRFGDPETQVVLALLDTPLTGLLHAAATHTLGSVGPLSWRTGSAVNIVVASQGYPAAPVTGQRIFGAELDGVLHAGTTLAADGTLRASGGRVLNCVAVGEDVTKARENAYKLVSNITLEGCHYRDDIAANVASHPEAAS